MRRGSSAQRGYGSRWQRYRKGFIAANPLCVFCLRMGRTEPTTVVDHIIPHRGDDTLFWDPSNHQGLCATCHSSTKQAEEKSGHRRGCDVDGNPIDPSHRWNQ